MAPSRAANGGSLKRKRSNGKPTQSRKPAKSAPSAGRKQREPREVEDDGEIGSGSGSDEDGLQDDQDRLEDEDVDDPRESAGQKRLRLAKMYLESLQEQEASKDRGGFDAADLDRDIIAERLRKDASAAFGRMHRFVAARVSAPASTDVHMAVKGHRLPLTAAVIDRQARHLYTASKDGSIAKWDLRGALSTDGGRVKRLTYRGKIVDSKDVKGKGRDLGHHGEILCLSIDDSGDILASGSTDKLVGVWDVSGDGLAWRRGLKGHKDSVSSLAFRHGSTQCFSASLDRSLKVFDLAALTYVETLYGHQDGVQAIDALAAEAAVSVGGRDKTCRWWKVVEETQLVFRAGGTSKIRDVIEGGLEEEDDAARPVRKFVEGSTDCVAMIDHGHFLSAGDSGSISLWMTGKKKPIFTHPLAHGLETTDSATEGPIRKARWITGLAALPYGDIFASGSWDGSVRLWALDPSLKSFAPLFDIAAAGIVNSLQIVQKDEDSKPLVIASLSQEPRFGRWMRIKEAKNVALVAALPLSPSQ